MNVIEEYNYSYEDRNIIIKVGKKSNTLGETLYFAKTNYKHIIAFAECKEKVLENCIKKIKFSIALFEKKINLIEQNQAINSAKKCFEDNFMNNETINYYKDNLSYNIFVEDEILTLNVTVSKVDNSIKSKSMDVVAVVYVNLITGECDIIKNTQVLKAKSKLTL